MMMRSNRVRIEYKLILKFQWGIRSEYKNEDDGVGVVEAMKLEESLN